MRHKDNTKVLKRTLKYAVLNNKTQTITIYRFKKQVADLLNISTRTLDRNIPYNNGIYEVYLITNVVL